MVKPVSDIGEFIHKNKFLTNLRKRNYLEYLKKLSELYDTYEKGFTEQTEVNDRLGGYK